MAHRFCPVHQVYYNDDIHPHYCGRCIEEKLADDHETPPRRSLVWPLLEILLIIVLQFRVAIVALGNDYDLGRLAIFQVVLLIALTVSYQAIMRELDSRRAHMTEQ